MADPGRVEDRPNRGLSSSSGYSNVLLRMDTDDGKASVCAGSDCSFQRARCSLPRRHPRIVIALLASLGLTGVVLLALWAHCGSTVPGFAAGELVPVVLSASTDACSVVENDVEYHTHKNLKVLVNVDSAGMCCAECQRHPQCRVWIYRRVESLVGDGLQSFARNCHLRAFDSTEQMKKIPRLGVASGSLEVKAAVTARNISNHDTGTSFRYRHLIIRHQQQSNRSRTESASALDEEPQVARKEKFEEVSEDNVEWQVVSQTAPVLLGPSMKKAMCIGEKWRGEVLTGRRVGSQVHLSHDFGFVPISAANGTAYLNKRTVLYRKILLGSCAESSLTPINNPVVCTAAAVALGYFDQHVTVYPGNGPRPEGCYIHEGQVWLSQATSNRGRGALGSSWPVCSSGFYPTTTSTTITTTTLTTTTTPPYPSLFCFEVVRITSFELSLARQQHLRRLSVFACDESLVFSDGKEPQELGRDDNNLTVRTVVVTTSTGRHREPDDNKTDLWPSTQDFLEVWSYLQQDGRIFNHDWTAKVDPDAVFFPDRLRNQLKAHTDLPDRSVYAANCDAPNPPGLYSPLEAFSRGALRTFFHDGHDCQANLPEWGWAEDNFMSHCMDMLGVGRVYADNMLSDKRCAYSPCSDGMKAAYYNYSDASPTGVWFRCWHESTGMLLPGMPVSTDTVADAAASNTTAAKGKA